MAELEAEPGSPVFFHDYHLYLAPRFVRSRVPEAALSHFVHIPWPEPDYWRVLPEGIRRALHDGLLANETLVLEARVIVTDYNPTGKSPLRVGQKVRVNFGP